MGGVGMLTRNKREKRHVEASASQGEKRKMVDGRPMKRYELKKEFGFSNFPNAVDTKLERVDHVPPLGALVLTRQSQRWIIGGAMGICTGTKCVFLSKEGVLHLPLDAIKQAWIKRVDKG